MAKKLKTFNVTVYEKYTKTIEVKAESQDDAEEIVNDMLNNEEIEIENEYDMFEREIEEVEEA